MLRGSLVGLIYDRTLLLQDGVYDESAAISIMGTDVDRIAGTMDVIHEVWAQLIEVALGIWLLARQIGWVCVLPIIIVVCRLIHIK